jgi:hypothetical protein
MPHLKGSELRPNWRIGLQFVDSRNKDQLPDQKPIAPIQRVDRLPIDHKERAKDGKEPNLDQEDVPMKGEEGPPIT